MGCASRKKASSAYPPPAAGRKVKCCMPPGPPTAMTIRRKGRGRATPARTARISAALASASPGALGPPEEDVAHGLPPRRGGGREAAHAGERRGEAPFGGVREEGVAASPLALVAGDGEGVALDALDADLVEGADAVEAAQQHLEDRLPERPGGRPVALHEQPGERLGALHEALHVGGPCVAPLHPSPGRRGRARRRRRPRRAPARGAASPPGGIAPRARGRSPPGSGSAWPRSGGRGAPGDPARPASDAASPSRKRSSSSDTGAASCSSRWCALHTR